jgi:hypothetical protein
MYSWCKVSFIDRKKVMPFPMTSLLSWIAKACGQLFLRLRSHRRGSSPIWPNPYSFSRCKLCMHNAITTKDVIPLQWEIIFTHFMYIAYVLSPRFENLLSLFCIIPYHFQLHYTLSFPIDHSIFTTLSQTLGLGMFHNTFWIPNLLTPTLYKRYLFSMF